MSDQVSGAYVPTLYDSMLPAQHTSVITMAIGAAVKARHQGGATRTEPKL